MSWFDLHDWEAGGRFYERFGVRWFRQFVVGANFWQRKIPALSKVFQYGRWNKKNVSGYIRQSHFAEVAHLSSFLVLVIVAIVFWTKSAYIEIAVVSVVNVMVNILPVIAVRYNRGRILARIKSLNQDSGKYIEG